MSCQSKAQSSAGCTCGCCSGTSVQTPGTEVNSPGQSAIRYRTGEWATFKESMLSRLSSSDYPALAGLKTRADDDYSIALLDASAVMLDILTFYQERLANESYLRTATRLESLTWLGRLIGYRPSPGVSASTYLAFTLTAAPGLPTNLDNKAISIPAGTTVQSVPEQGHAPQSFETSAPTLGKPDWNALPVQTGHPWKPDTSTRSVYLVGTATQLNPGDAFLVVGDERIDHPTSQQWDVRIVSTVYADTVNRRTQITWQEALGSASTGPAVQAPKFFAFRQKAALYGFNAINPALLTDTARKALGSGVLTSAPEWIFNKDRITGQNFGNEFVVDLDAVYTKVVPGGWLVLLSEDANTSRTPAGWVNLFAIAGAGSASRSDYGMSTKVTRIAIDHPPSTQTTLRYLLNGYNSKPRSTTALAQSEQLTVAEEPLDHPLYGTLLDLGVVRRDLVGVKAIAVTGRRQKIVLKPGVAGIQFVPDDDPAKTAVAAGDVFTLLQPPSLLNGDGSIADWAQSTIALTLVVADANGRSGTLLAALHHFDQMLAVPSDPVVQEFALVAGIHLETQPFTHTRIVLRSRLQNCYDRTITTVNANVGAATGGASVTELVGSGAAATLNQSFTLKQKPLTYVQSATSTGSTSSLEISVNGARWTEVQSLYAQPPDGKVYETANLTNGTAELQFGDGSEGSTVATGQNNIMANYRVGLGAAGNVAAGTITTLVDRPLGVSGVTNPSPATGGQDAQTVKEIRTFAPLGVLTLGRAVSILDYRNFAATFAGIAKADALWIPNGRSRGVFLTVAGANGVALTGSDTLRNLVEALRRFGTPNIAIYARSFYETVFSVRASVAYDPAHDPASVRAAILELLSSTYSFANRDFGQGVSADEVTALLQGVQGVVAVNVSRLAAVATSAGGDLGGASFSMAAWTAWIAAKKTIKRPHAEENRICPYVPKATLNSLPGPAELIVISPDPKAVVLEVMA